MRPFAVHFESDIWSTFFECCSPIKIIIFNQTFNEILSDYMRFVTFSNSESDAVLCFRNSFICLCTLAIWSQTRGFQQAFLFLFKCKTVRYLLLQSIYGYIQTTLQFSGLRTHVLSSILLQRMRRGFSTELSVMLVNPYSQCFMWPFVCWIHDGN
jgi:hypothetical protein